jgi:predicted porin
MKKLGLATVLGLCAASGALAQSSVTVFGTLDVNVRRINYSGNGSVTGVGTFGGAPSFIAFKGTEDLGSGMTASFFLDSAVFPDTGNNATSVGLPFWNRGSWVSLASDSAGTIRLGRDWSTSYFGQWEFDPTFNLGVGNHLHLSHVDGNFMWRSNSVQYIAPTSLPGFSARLMYSFGEASAGGSYTGGRAAYTSGPINVAASYGSTSGTTGGNSKLANLGGSYDFGAAKAMLFLANSKQGDMAERRWAVSALAPVGSASLWASYSKVSTNAAGKAGGWFGADQLAAGASYALSKRTALYAAVARLNNDGSGVLNIEEPGSFTFASPGGSRTKAGGSNTGFEVGIRTSF